jgi:hypothetical protein
METMTRTASSTSSAQERRGHEYHAEANLLSGDLERPIAQKIPPQGSLCLRDWRGGHLYQRVHGYDLEGLVSFKSGYTRVSGYRSDKKSQAFVTLATSVIEGLNVFDVLTADRVVAQVSTEHEPTEGDLGHVPRVTFLGTQFVNLKISGFDVTATLNPEICGERPAGDVPYLHDADFLKSVREQADEIGTFADFPAELKETSDKFQETYQNDINDVKRLEEFVGQRDGDSRDSKLVCSLVDSIMLPKAIPGVTVVRNVMYIRDFGIVSLGNVEAGRRNEGTSQGRPEMSNYFTIKMFDMRLGCVGEGNMVAVSGSGNGKGKP